MEGCLIIDGAFEFAAGFIAFEGESGGREMGGAFGAAQDGDFGFYGIDGPGCDGRWAGVCGQIGCPDRDGVFSVGQVLVVLGGGAGLEVVFVEGALKGAVGFAALERDIGVFLVGVDGRPGQVGDFWSGGIDGPDVLDIGAGDVRRISGADDKCVLGVAQVFVEHGGRTVEKRAVHGARKGAVVLVAFKVERGTCC